MGDYSGPHLYSQVLGKNDRSVIQGHSPVYEIKVSLVVRDAGISNNSNNNNDQTDQTICFVMGAASHLW